MVPTLKEAGPDYLKRWHAMEVSPAVMQKAAHAAETIFAHKTLYAEVEKQTSVPWYWVACIHYREADLRFTEHLANGDSLKHDTVHVPRHLMGRNGPFTWDQGAIAALKHDHVAVDHTFADFCYRAEAYNGWGYRGVGVTSPYLWSQSNQHERGKYVRDHDYEASAIDEQLGVLVVLKALMAHDASIQFSDLPEAPKGLVATVKSWLK